MAMIVWREEQAPPLQKIAYNSENAKTHKQA